MISGDVQIAFSGVSYDVLKVELPFAFHYLSIRRAVPSSTVLATNG